MTKENSSDKSLVHVIEMLWHWRKRIFVVTILATAISAVGSLLIPNYYQSQSLFYAASEDLAKPNPIGDVDREIKYYGTDKDIDRILSIATSNHLLNHLITKFELYKHYDIDPSAERSAFKVRQKLNKLVDIKKTKYGAIFLGIEDTSAELARSMVEEATNYINAFASKNFKGSQSNLLASYKAKITESEGQLRKLNDSLILLKSTYDVYDLINQGEVLLNQQSIIQNKLSAAQSKVDLFNKSTYQSDSASYYKDLASGFKNQLQGVNRKIEKFNKGYNEVYNLDRQQMQMSRQLALDKERQNQLKASFGSDIAMIHIIEKAELANIKSRPKRSLYVLASGFLAFALMSLLAIIVQSYAHEDWSFLKR